MDIQAVRGRLVDKGLVYFAVGLPLASLLSLTRIFEHGWHPIYLCHAILAGLDPCDEMGYALAHDKLWTVHLNDQNGLKYDQDKTFGAVDLRRALNQVRILDKYDYGRNGEWVGLDVKAMRTQKDEVATRHLSNSLKIFMHLLEVSRSLDETEVNDFIHQRNYEDLEMYIISKLLNK